VSASPTDEASVETHRNGRTRPSTTAQEGSGPDTTMSERPAAASSDAFTRIERRRVAQDGIDLIKHLIMTGQLAAHQQLPSERELATQLGISRPTLRESIRALIALNILESRHGEGTFVASLDPESLAEPIDFVLELNMGHLADLTEIRLILEPEMTALATERVSPEIIERLEKIVATKADNDRQVPPNLEQSNELDFQFHRTLAEATGNPVAITLLAALSSLSRASRRATAPLIYQDYLEEETDDLRVILDAIKAGDGVAARAAMRDHIGRVAALVDRKNDGSGSLSNDPRPS